MLADLSRHFSHEEFECGFFRKNPYRLDQARSLRFYETIFRRMIPHFKYRRQMEVFSEMDRLLEKFFEENLIFFQGFTVLSYREKNVLLVDDVFTLGRVLMRKRSDL